MTELAPGIARQPKRRRGHQRVAAIMAAATEAIAERGYDAATMTEIAARSGTAIGSLYRFFPSKEALADALLRQYAEQAVNGLAELAERAAEMGPGGLADALVDFRLALQSQRRFAIVLLDSRGGSEALREALRRAVRGGVANALQQAVPTLSRPRAEAMAMAVGHLLKGVNAAADEATPAAQGRMLAELREMLRLYLTAAAGQP